MVKTSPQPPMQGSIFISSIKMSTSTQGKVNLITGVVQSMNSNSVTQNNNSGLQTTASHIDIPKSENNNPLISGGQIIHS